MMWWIPSNSGIHSQELQTVCLGCIHVVICLVSIPCSPTVLKYVSVIYLHYILHSFSPEQFCIYVAVLLFLGSLSFWLQLTS